MNWTGDNQSLWVSLQSAIPQMCNMGLSGKGFTGTDVGGYGADCTGELFARWMQVGCFSPFFRNHSSRPSRHQEPWKFGKQILDISRNYIQLRYRLRAYYYDLFRIMESTGIPVMRPLVLEYEKDANVREINDEFMIGSAMLVAPVVEQGGRHRMIYLPEGGWIDFWTGEYREGNSYFVKKADLAECPVFIKQNSLLPFLPVRNYVGENVERELTLRLYGTEGSYVHYQDNGIDDSYKNGEFNEYMFEIKDDVFKAVFLHQGYSECYDSIRLIAGGKEYAADMADACKGVELNSLQ